jgi:hypothetical protein
MFRRVAIFRLDPFGFSESCVKTNIFNYTSIPFTTQQGCPDQTYHKQLEAQPKQYNTAVSSTKNLLEPIYRLVCLVPQPPVDVPMTVFQLVKALLRSNIS